MTSKTGLEFKVGDAVVYPAHGVGKVAAIETQEVAGMSLEVYVVTFDHEKMTLRVPTKKAKTAGLRTLAADDTVTKALTTLKGRARVKRTMWSRRAQEYEAKINSGEVSLPPAIASLTGNGFLAFLLNISSFNTNKLAGALTMTVCGNLKQCLTVLLGIVLFNVVIGWLNGTGMFITMLGAAIYSKAELDNKKKKSEPAYKPVEQNVR